MVVGYAKAYLTIMNKFPQFKTLYFDGFAGSGDIYRENETDISVITGTAVRVLEIDHPKSFDIYYFVEKNEVNKSELESKVTSKFPRKKSYVVCDDCNNKLVSMADYLRNNRNFRVLAFIDPYGMSLNWDSIESLRGYGIDLWILVPSGIGMNRLLKRDGAISDSWLQRLESFLGLKREFILDYFYKAILNRTLFGDEIQKIKEEDAIEKAGELYRHRLSEVFKYVSKPFPLKNSTGSIMYHFMMATNNKTALKIADDIIRNKSYGAIQY